MSGEQRRIGPPHDLDGAGRVDQFDVIHRWGDYDLEVDASLLAPDSAVAKGQPRARSVTFGRRA